jgi:hypothetical protein
VQAINHRNEAAVNTNTIQTEKDLIDVPYEVVKFAVQ